MADEQKRFQGRKEKLRWTERKEDEIGKADTTFGWQAVVHVVVVASLLRWTSSSYRF